MEVRNRFKGLDLIDRVPDELWNEVHDIVQDTEIKTIFMEKKCKKAKWLSEVLQTAVKRREAKSKRENERYEHLNAWFQRIAGRDKKAFFSDQCKEIEENNRILFSRSSEAFQPKIKMSAGLVSSHEIAHVPVAGSHLSVLFSRSVVSDSLPPRGL